MNPNREVRRKRGGKSVTRGHPCSRAEEKLLPNRPNNITKKNSERENETSKRTVSIPREKQMLRRPESPKKNRSRRNGTTRRPKRRQPPLRQRHRHPAAHLLLPTH